MYQLLFALRKLRYQSGIFFHDSNFKTNHITRLIGKYLHSGVVTDQDYFVFKEHKEMDAIISRSLRIEQFWLALLKTRKEKMVCHIDKRKYIVITDWKIRYTSNITTNVDPLTSCHGQSEKRFIKAIDNCK